MKFLRNEEDAFPDGRDHMTMKERDEDDLQEGTPSPHVRKASELPFHSILPSSQILRSQMTLDPQVYFFLSGDIWNLLLNSNFLKS